MKMRAIPKSRAKTAWGLLQDVKRVMLDEPRRVYMGTFCATSDGPLMRRDIKWPSCGTVGCVAGWVALLGHPRFDARDGDAETTAIELLGDVDYYTAGRHHSYVFDAGNGGDIKGEPGTKQYARSVVARIDKFMRVNEKALKAKRIP